MVHDQSFSLLQSGARQSSPQTPLLLLRGKWTRPRTRGRLLEGSVSSGGVRGPDPDRGKKNRKRRDAQANEGTRTDTVRLAFAPKREE